MRVAEIFESISGEVGGFLQGSPTTFIRLAGCNLHCPFCDTAWAIDLESGDDIDIETIVGRVDDLSWKQVLITGGEPLIQKEELQELIYQLKRNGYLIQIETNGTIRCDVSMVDYWVIDCKWPDAMKGIHYEFDPGPLNYKCWVKHLVGSEEDLKKAIRMIRVSARSSGDGPRFSISPILGISHGDALTGILRSQLPILLNVQIHKMIGAR